MDTLWQDIRYAARALIKTPGFSVVAILTLALGVGANTAIFSVVNAMLLRALPYPQSEQLVNVSNAGEMGRMSMAYADITDLRNGNKAMSDISAYTQQRYNFTGAGDPRELSAVQADPQFFKVLGIKPILGRAFTDAELRQRVAVLSHALWMSAFASDRNVIGRTVQLDGQPYTVIGVMPKGFQFPSEDVRLWTPLGGAFESDPQIMTNRGFHAFSVVGRMRAGVTLETTNQQLDIVAKRLAAAARAAQDAAAAGGGGGGQRVIIANGGPPPSGAAARGPMRIGGPGGRPADLGISAAALRDEVVGDTRPALLIMLGSVALVLLIACANAANLLVARANGRRKELAVRAALGAGRWRLVRQLLTESMLLSFVAAAVGLVLGYWGIRALMALWPESMPRAQNIGIDGAVLAFTLAIAVLTGLAFGVVPALRAASVDPEETLKERGNSSLGRRRQHVQSFLVIGEMALALVLLVGAGLLVRSFVRLNNVQMGFDAGNVLAARVRLTPGRHVGKEQQRAFYQDVMNAVKSHPEVETVSQSRTLPLSGSMMMMGIRPQRIRPADPEPFLPLAMAIIGPDYFKAMRIPMISGRPFNDTDRAESPQSIIISAALAKRLWPGENPIGRQMPLRMPRLNGPGEVTPTIIGVAADVRHEGLDQPVRPELYLPYLEMGLEPTDADMWFVVRGKRDALRLAAVVRDAVRRADPQQPVAELVALEQFVRRSTAARRFNMTLITTFAALALGLALIGIYAVTAFSVAQRTRELGIRVALGARRRDVLGMLLGESMRLAGIGALIGIAAAFGLSRLLSSMLYDVSATDVRTFIGTPLILLSAALFAIVVPALRATRADPMIALRQE